ncbi:MAG: hypothetical protein JWN77_1417 [Frankiales bacterium]|jgi:hypothetical protein|nr:hypothetical protein [Frankiales bacterium]
MNRTAMTAEVAAVAGLQLALAALLARATERGTLLDTPAAAATLAQLPVQRAAP